MEPKFWNGIKQTVGALLIGAALSVVPFYFQTVAQTEQTKQIDREQQAQIDTALEGLHHLQVSDAVDQTKITQVETTLERIEKKIDRLNESRR